MRRLSIVSLLLTLSALLVMSPARAAGWTAKLTTLDLQAGPGNTAAFLAPDGSRFAYVKINDLCMYSLAGEKGNCLTLEKHIHMDLDTVRWSPDSTKLAFSEDFLTTRRDSDIWVYDVATNTVTDITPAPNRTANIMNSDPKITFTIDLVPQWSSDSLSIFFVRYTFNKPGNVRTVFSRVDLKDSSVEEVVPVAPVDANFPFTVYGFAVSPDDSQIAYARDTRNSQTNDGTWFLDLTTKETKFAAAPVEKTMPRAYQFSSDSKLVLSIGVNDDFSATFEKPETSPIYTLPLSGGRQQQLNNDIYVFSAGWGPEGTELAYTTAEYLEGNKAKSGLYITSAPGQAGELVLPGRFIAPTPHVRTPIMWAANNTLILSQIPDFKLVVVQLSQS